MQYQSAIRVFTVLVVLGSGLFSPVALAQKLYWADRGDGKIMRSNLDGSNVETLLQGLDIPDEIAVDPVGRRLYWISSVGFIQTAYWGSNNVETIFSGSIFDAPSSLAVDSLSGKLYFPELGFSETAKLRRMNSDGSNLETLFTTTVEILRGISVLPLENKIYWIERQTTSSSTRIRRANLDGSNNQSIVPFPLPGCHWGDLVVSPTLNQIFYSNTSCRRIYSANVLGANSTEIHQIPNGSINALALDEAGEKLYFSATPFVDGGGPTNIYRCNLDGSSVETIFLGPTPHYEVGGLAIADDVAAAVPSPLVQSIGCRYLAVTPAKGKQAIALKLVSSPSQFIQADGSLGATPVIQTPAQWGTVYVHGAQIIPLTNYEIRALTLDTVEQPSDPTFANTGVWGDAKEPGNGLVNLDDILEVISDFADSCSFCEDKLGSDLVGANGSPDGQVSLDDILAGLSAFSGHPF